MCHAVIGAVHFLTFWEKYKKGFIKIYHVTSILSLGGTLFNPVFSKRAEKIKAMLSQSTFANKYFLINCCFYNVI